jgi:polar amino acid transport system substrate-binding protein
MPGTDKPTDIERAAVVPSGRLRVAIAVGPASSTLWTTRDEATGAPRGVTVDLGKALADWLGVPCDLIEHASSGAIIDAAPKGTWDVGFTPVDALRRTQVLFGPDYAVGDSTLLVGADSSIASVATADREGVRVVGVENTATIRSARKAFTKASVVGVTGLDEAVALFASGEADAIGLGRDSLASLLPKLPGTRVLDDNFHQATTAIALPLGKEAALAVVTRFMEAAKANGLVRSIFDRNGMPEAAVAPPQGS